MRFALLSFLLSCYMTAVGAQSEDSSLPNDNRDQNPATNDIDPDHNQRRHATGDPNKDAAPDVDHPPSRNHGSRGRTITSIYDPEHSWMMPRRIILPAENAEDTGDNLDHFTTRTYYYNSYGDRIDPHGLRFRSTDTEQSDTQ